MIPLYRILSYSFYSELGVWVGDRFINEFMHLVSKRGKGKFPPVSALLCTSSYFPGLHERWRLGGRNVYLDRNRNIALPNFIVLNGGERSVERALTDVAGSMIVDIRDFNTGKIIVQECCVSDLKKDGGIDVLGRDKMVQKLLQER